MIPYYKSPSVNLQKHVFILFAIVIFISLFLLTARQKENLITGNKPCCLKGYICKTMSGIAR
jgi:hypothetical protein